MIIPAQFENAYDTARPTFERLRSRCEPQLHQIADDAGGMFADRIKSLESAYLKAETGRFKRPFDDIPDMYAATIALPTVETVESVCSMLATNFEVVERRSDRSRSPHEFIYDDVHLILRLRPSALIPDKSLFRLKFELQVKSLLQFAWSKATHETIYKSKEVSWQQDRLAAEARAGLELIDSLLADVSSASLLQLERENEDYVRRQGLVSLLVTRWSSHQLPEDLRRCAQSIDELLTLANMDLTALGGLLDVLPGRDYVSASSLTPVQAVLAAILHALDDAEVEAFCRRAKRNGIRFLVTPSMAVLAPRTQLIPSGQLVKL